MKDINELETQEKNIKRNNSLPLYTLLLNQNQKSKYRNKKLYHCGSLQKINENSEISGLTRINTMNRSNGQINSISAKKQKGKVTFAPKYRLINYIEFDPKDSILNNTNIKIDNEQNEKKEQYERNKIKNEENIVCFHCSCILI